MIYLYILGALIVVLGGLAIALKIARARIEAAEARLKAMELKNKVSEFQATTLIHINDMINATQETNARDELAEETKIRAGDRSALDRDD